MGKVRFVRKHLAVGAAAALTIGLGTVSTPAAHAATPDYTIELLPPAAGAWHSWGGAINDRGDVAGNDRGDGSGRGLLWRAGARSTPVTITSGETTAVGVSESEVVAGYYATKGSTSYRQFLWRDGELSLLPEQTNWMVGISASGTALTREAKLWTDPASGAALPRQGNGVTFSGYQATGISPNGNHVVASSFNTRGISTPVIWTNRKLRALSAPFGVSDSRPEAVNDGGVAVGASKIPKTRPVIWDSAGNPSFLPMVPKLQWQSATAINNSGIIVGNSHLRDQEMGSEHGLLWRGGKVDYLDDVVDTPDGATILDATDINTAGQIVGTIRLKSGALRAYIATPKKVDVYTTPGIHHVNGRDWKTTCEDYSQTTRCRTEIIATEVKVVGGKYTHVKDWTFNNLTYLPSERTLWEGNPLGNKGDYTIGGRKWRTECDSPQTGRGGCRSYILGTKIKAHPQGGGTYTYTQSNEWVFNNIVLFS